MHQVFVANSGIFSADTISWREFNDGNINKRKLALAIRYSFNQGDNPKGKDVLWKRVLMLCVSQRYLTYYLILFHLCILQCLHSMIR